MGCVVTGDMSEPTMRAALDCANRRWLLDNQSNRERQDMGGNQQTTGSGHCEFCAADGGGCGACPDEADTREILTPSYLRDAGEGFGEAGDTAAHAIAAVQSEFGPLAEWQLAALIEGHATGVRYAAERRAEGETVSAASQPGEDEYPF